MQVWCDSNYRRRSIFDERVTHAADGTGHGLAIVRDIAAAHGWTIIVTDSESGGARFGITGVASGAASSTAAADREQAVE